MNIVKKIVIHPDNVKAIEFFRKLRKSKEEAIELMLVRTVPMCEKMVAELKAAGKIK